MKIKTGMIDQTLALKQRRYVLEMIRQGDFSYQEENHKVKKKVWRKANERV